MAYSYDSRVVSGAKLQQIKTVARKVGIPVKYMTLFGDYVAKIDPEMLGTPQVKKRKEGKMVLVTGITPTHLGEGKTVTTIGLSMALNSLKKKSICCLRQPSLGPTFGLKGGGTGGGHAQVLPPEDINFHFTGDEHAVANAQNLCASFVDNSLYWGDPYKLGKNGPSCRRVMDINDRSLRNVSIGGGGKLHGVSRRTGLGITPASECMAALSLAKDLKDLRKRMASIVVGYSEDGKAVTTEDVQVAGAMTALLLKAFWPNFVQTIENTPCFVHTGCFANLSHGSSSVIADKLALKLSDYTVCESGFGADLGAEKFFDIKCRQSGIKPDVVVINCSIRALKVHSGDYSFTGTKVPVELTKENLSAVDRGCSNLEKQVENLKMFGIPVVLCINRFDSDSVKELEVLKRRAEALELDGYAVSEVYKQGSKGGLELAEAVIEAAEKKSKLRYLYPVDMGLKRKIERIAKSVYGASEVDFADTAAEEISRLKENGLDKMPVCIAKSHLSLSNNSSKKGRPRGFKLRVVEIEVHAGAGYVLAKCKGVNSMPGLPRVPRGTKIDVDTKTGLIKNLLS